MNKKTHVKGQILVIIIMVLSILSIFALAMVSNARKDTQEKRDNKRYEQYYAIGEKKLVEAQNLLKIKQLNQAQTLLTSLNYTCTTSLVDTQWGLTNQYRCTSPVESFSQYESGSIDSIQTTLEIIDQPVLELFQLPSDGNVKLTILKNAVPYTGLLNIYWNSPNTQTVHWEIALDYTKDYVNYDTVRYNSFKLSTLDITQPSTSPGIISNLTTLPIMIGGVNFQYGISINMQSMVTAAIGSNNYAITGLRIKPLIGKANSSVSFSIVPSNLSTFPAQFRKMTAIINSTVNLATGTDSPTPILNIEYPLTLPSNPLLDYVFRGGYWEQI